MARLCVCVLGTEGLGMNIKNLENELKAYPSYAKLILTLWDPWDQGGCLGLPHPRSPSLDHRHGLPIGFLLSPFPSTFE